MATLTGFKAVGESATGQQQTNGQQNPVFVFDEVDVGDANNEEFVDASSQSSVVVSNTNKPAIQQPRQQQPQQPLQNGQHEDVIDKQINNGHSNNSAVTIEISEAKQESENNSTQETMKQQTETKDGHHNDDDDDDNNVSKTPPEKRDNKTTTKQAFSKQTSSATGNQIQKVASQQKAPPPPRQQRSTQNSLNPNNAIDDDSISITPSVLAIDCIGTGKSPRQPRRSPLMALFRGKPRESVRRLYTDEDQFEIEWANLSLEVQKKWYHKFSLNSILGSQDEDQNKPEKPRLILNGVDGRIKSGEITAVLGPSGAGKTSLLNCLFGKYRTAIQGSIKVTGAPSKKHLTVCTIPQSDYLIGYLTTEESLWFASRLKNCEDDFNHDRNIERVIELLGLQRCRQTRINKLSGGQYKRVSIAQEMLSSPDILVLDEPTSGLDSLTCYRTVKVLRDLVEASKAHNLVNPMSIILTIHQPHREVLDLFHSVYVMAVGGQTLYQGPPTEMEDCINKCSGTSMPAQGYNPASFMVELASEEYGRKPIESLVLKQREKFRDSTNHKYNYDFTVVDGQQGRNQNSNSSGNQYSSNSSISSGKNNTNKGSSTITLYPLDDGGGKNKYVDVDLNDNGKSNNGFTNKDIDSRIMTPRSGKNSDGVFWRHVSLMSKRCFLSNTRDPLLCTIRVGAHIFIPLVVALIYGPKMGIPNGCPFYKPEINLLEYASMGVEEIEQKHDDIRIQFQNVGLHFMVYYAFGLCMLAFTAISFPLIMHVLIKEIRNGWYSLATFILGKMFAELPMAIILPPISVGIIYIMTGQPSSYLQWRYFVQSLLLILIVMIAEAKGLIFGAVCMNSMQTAVFAASVSTVPFILLSGFLIRIREVPYVLQHLAKFSYFKHSVEALILTRYGFGMCPCDPDLIPVGGTPRIIGIPPQIMSLTDYYVNAFVASPDNSTLEDTTTTTTETNIVGNNRNINRIVNSITTLSPEIENMEAAESANGGRSRRAARVIKPASTSTTTTTVATTIVEEEPEDKPVKQGVFFDKLATLLTRANAFGYQIITCDDVEPFTMKDMKLKDNMLPPLIGYLFLYIVILKFISYFIVEICVKLKL